MEDRELYITGGKMRDKFLTEAMGECYHTIEAAETFPRYGCSKCGLDIDDCIENDFSTWENFGKLWEWAIEQDWWLKFKGATQKEIGAYSLRDCIEDKWINPGNFADAIYEYLKNRG